MRRQLARRRVAAVSMPLTLLALTTTISIPTLAGASGEARIGASEKRVAIGDRVTLRGSFPGAAKAAVELRFRPAGESAWRPAGKTRTGASGRYSARVKPRRSGYWQARLASPPVRHSAPSTTTAGAGGADADTNAARIAVRSRTTARVGGRHALTGRTVQIHGTVTPPGAKRRVVVRVGGQREVTRASRDGEFRVAWQASRTGTYPVRVKARGNRLATGSSDNAGRVTVYRRAAASWYGPGLYGNRTACGGTLSPGTLGVAHKSMPCGTRLTLRYGSRSVRVKVIDRGPYAGNREFDLTSATKQRLGFPDTGTVLTSR
jgi:hypothetical protein